jgi:hypothetical protein
VLATKVTLVHGSIPDDNTIVSNRAAAAVTPAEFIKDGVFLALISDQHSNSVAHFHVVNNTSYDLLVAFTTEKNDHFKGEFAGTIPGNSSKRIYSANMSDIQIWPKLRLEALFHTAASFEPKPAISFHQHLKGKDLSVAKQEIAMLKTKGWLFQLDQKEEALDLDKLKARFK